jgi:AbrB family looped-hinge helix DNA binding protein
VRVTIDSAGRLTIPKALRDELGFAAGGEVELSIVEGRLQLAMPSLITVEQGPYGSRFVAPASGHLTTNEVRDLIERGRR